MVAAAIRKSVPRLKWVRLREKISTPVSGSCFLGEGRVFVRVLCGLWVAVGVWGGR